MKQLPILAVLTLAVAATVGAQEKKFKKNYDQDGVYWVSWDDGVEEAKARNAPIHFTMHKDG